MTDHPSLQTNAAPSVSEFTASPLRNRMRLELAAPVAEVWELLGDLSRFPEYSAGLERVETTLGDDGRCTEYTCYFKPVEGGSHGAVSRDVMRWYEPQRGYLSVEVEGDAGTDGAVALTTLDQTPDGTLVGFDMYYDAEDLGSMKAVLDEVFDDMAERLIGRFGGSVTERYVEKQ
ncbi:MAG TPA: SRPBCC family protein [Gaiellaceae bacterium]|nr:SRPBCC family protein [Gaiellaceae bacterium]